MARSRNKRSAVGELSSALMGFGALCAVIGYFAKSTPLFLLGGVLCGLSIGIPVWMKMEEEERLKRSGIDEIDKMDGRDFEKWLELFFARKGYKVTRTPYQGDWGADLILQDPDQASKIAVQAKRWKGMVGVEAVQQIAAARSHYGCHKAMVVTNAFFTDAARKLAQSNHVELWDRDRLVREILAVSPAVPAQKPVGSRRGR